MTSDSDNVISNTESERIPSADFEPVSKKREKTEVSKNSEQEEAQFKYKCAFPDCGQRFKRSTYLDHHEFHNHTNIKKHVCTFDGCDKSYITYTHLTRHIRTFHQKKLEQLEPKRIKCNIPTCFRYFNTATNMERHIRQYHENPKIYSCTECSFTCRHKMRFYKHMEMETQSNLGKNNKPNKKSYPCGTCAEIFNKWSELVKHRKKYHRPTCEICGHTFSKGSNLRIHLLDHKRKEQKITFTCPHEGCTRSYLQKRNLQEHVRVKHEEKQQKCPVEGCGKALSCKKRLERHIELHSKDDIQVVRKVQAQRKDKGRKKSSKIPILSGITVPKDVEKMILNGKGQDIKIDSNFITTSDSDGEEISVPRNIRFVI